MKTMSKKVLSLLLSILLIVTSIPSFAFASFADDGEINEADVTAPIKAAMDAYEAKMDGTVYINMKNAYNAYVSAQQAIDAVQYGDVDVDVNTVAATLTSATNAMTPISEPVANATHASRDADGAINADYAKNLLYAEKQSVLASSGANKDTKAEISMSAKTIALYDGSNDIRIPVLLGWMYDQAGFSNRQVVAAYATNNETSGRPSDNPNFQLQENWRGTNNNGTYDWNAAWNDNNVQVGCYNATLDLYIQSSTTASRNKWSRLANYVKYVGGASGFTNGLKTVSPGWYVLTNQKKGSNEHHKYMTNVGTIYVIDYASFKTAMTNKSSLLGTVNNAKQGGALNLLTAYETAIAAMSNINGVTPDTVSDRAKALSDAAAALSSATVTTDTGYAALRSAINLTRNTYKNVDSTKYTTETWQPFARAYEDARAIFANIQSTGYNNTSDAEAKAAALEKAFKELATNEVKADTTALETVIDNADDAIANAYIFTADSYAAANLEALVTAAKEGVWGGDVENYKVDAEKLNDTAENDDIIENHRLTLVNAINKLVINYDQTVASVNGYSLNSAIEYANSLDSNDYGNFYVVTNAVSNANQFMNNGSTVIDPTHVNSVIDSTNLYIQLIRDIINATKGLHPSFFKTQNGTQISAGNEVKTTVSYSAHNNETKSITFTRNDNQVFFRTTHDEFVFDLNGATLDFYTNQSYDCHFDAINMNDIAPDGELNSVSKLADSGTDVRDYPGSNSVQNAGGTFKLSNIYVTSTSSDILGHDNDGNNVTDPSFDFTEGIASESGTYPTKGCITAHNGTTRAVATYTLSGSYTNARTLTASTIPTKNEYNPSGNFGMLYWYKYVSGAFKYYGYRHGSTPYSQKATVIDVAYLFDLIRECDQITNAGYTSASYSEFVTALGLSKSDFDYSSMSPDEILSECVTRYTRLFNAKEALVPAANNTSLKDAVALTMNTYQTGKANYSESSWNVFVSAFEAARTAYNGKYSDSGVADFGTSEQSVIDAIAKALMDAYNALESFANFQPVYDAATALANLFEDEKYSYDSLLAVAEQLKDASLFPYLNMTDEQAKTVFADNQSLIDAEAAEISKLTAQTASIDGSALEAVIAKVKNDYRDPDAWEGVEEAIAKIRSMTLYAPVEIYKGITVSGVKFANQGELDAEITNLLSSVSLKKYTVTVDGTVIGTYDYGTSIDVPSADGSMVDWYYTYSSQTSNTSSSAEKYDGKYLSSTDVLTFVVKGNTVLTTKAATQETVKITYVNALTGNTIATDYVVKGSSVAELPAAPSLVYYRFDNYTVKGGSEFTASTTVDKDTIVYANYSKTADDELYTLYIWNLDGAQSEDEFMYYYNDRIDILEELYVTPKKATKGVIKVNGEEVKLLSRRDAKDDQIYAWALINKNDFDDWYDQYDAGEWAEDCGYMTIVKYGVDYSFFMQDDTYLVALTEDEFNEFDADYVEEDMFGNVTRGNGMIDKSNLDENGATVAARDAIVRNNDDTKFSMIGTFTLPEGAQEVEYGMLFTTATGSELTLETVGTNGIARMKSSQCTVGGQFVISVKSTKLAGQSVDMQYRAYLTYKAADGTLNTVYSNDVTLTEQF